MPAHSTNVKPCVCCNVRKGYQSGGLCFKCYHTPGVRERFPAPPRSVPQERVCPQCKNIFGVPRPSDRHIFCSHACRGLFFRRPSEERFWEKVDKSGECWLWTANAPTGYGQFSLTWDKAVMAHRFSFELANGPIPDGLFVCHRCDTPLCVRPDHLFLGTPKDNTQDCIAKGRWNRNGIRNVPRPDMQGPKSYNAKLTEEQVRQILARAEPVKELAERFGVTKSLIYQIRRRTAWKHLG